MGRSIVSPRAHLSRGRRLGGSGGFTIVELLVVIGIIALLLSILLPSLSAARRAAQTVACLSNIRQLLTASIMYAQENDGHWPPAAADGGTTNLLRWHGSRENATSPFELNRDPSPLKDYLAEGLKECPTLGGMDITRGFEANAGGYGFNQNYLGSKLAYYGPTWPTPPDGYDTAAKVTQVRRSAETVAFADTAFAYDWSVGEALFEYSFVSEPIGPWGPQWPSIHFRHNRRSANIGWADGHATTEQFEWTMPVTDPNNWFGIDFDAKNLGWFGPKDNTYFDLD